MNLKKVAIPLNTFNQSLNYNVLQEVQEKMYRNLNRQLEDIVLEGLKRKGYEYKRGPELNAFVEKHCRIEDNINLKEKVYYVDDTPFLLHKYEFKMENNFRTTERDTTITATIGGYAFL